MRRAAAVVEMKARAAEWVELSKGEMTMRVFFIVAVVVKHRLPHIVGDLAQIPDYVPTKI